MAAKATAGSTTAAPARWAGQCPRAAVVVRGSHQKLYVTRYERERVSGMASWRGRRQTPRCRKAGQKDAKYLAIKVVSRGEKETKQEIKAEAARDEFEGGVGHLTARGEDGGERGDRCRRFWSFGDMCCRYGHRRRRTGRAGGRGRGRPPWTSKSPPCWSKMAPRLTPLFDIPFPATSAAARRPNRAIGNS